VDGWVRSRLYTHQDESFTVSRTQDVEPILDQNKAFQNDPQKKSAIMGHHIMGIPLIVVEKWINELGVNILNMPKFERTKFLRRIYNDPDWRWLRTR